MGVIGMFTNIHTSPLVIVAWKYIATRRSKSYQDA